MSSALKPFGAKDICSRRMPGSYSMPLARHFFKVYVLVVVAIAGVSWLQEQLWLAFGETNVRPDAAHIATLALLEQRLRSAPDSERDALAAQLGDELNLVVEILPNDEVAGTTVRQRLQAGDAVPLHTSREHWLLKRWDAQHVLALRYPTQPIGRDRLEWALALFFYAAIALVVMAWLWPLTRDLRTLELATSSFGNRNWLFDADISPRSQVFPLAATFRKMAARIDDLIGSHKDMSNAVAHEIKTPLSRMQFEIEMAQQVTDHDAVKQRLHNIKQDIDNIDALVAATMEYAILERADMAPNMSAHDLTQLLPAITTYVQASSIHAPPISVIVDNDATQVICDAHLIETVVKNLLFNATRFADKRIQLTFTTGGGSNTLMVDDDGPGVPPAERTRVFASFVQLEKSTGRDKRKSGFGLGLAIVKRAIEWHNGHVLVEVSPFGGARFIATWPRATTCTGAK
jgi:two-component system OmpR family sensor kinase